MHGMIFHFYYVTPNELKFELQFKLFILYKREFFQIFLTYLSGVKNAFCYCCFSGQIPSHFVLSILWTFKLNLFYPIEFMRRNTTLYTLWTCFTLLFKDFKQQAIQLFCAYWYVLNVSIIFDCFMLMLCLWHLFLY